VGEGSSSWNITRVRGCSRRKKKQEQQQRETRPKPKQECNLKPKGDMHACNMMESNKTRKT
jgi:hypothetical protein